jgi:hypothetical protein
MVNVACLHFRIVSAWLLRCSVPCASCLSQSVLRRLTLCRACESVPRAPSPHLASHPMLNSNVSGRASYSPYTHFLAWIMPNAPFRIRICVWLMPNECGKGDIHGNGIACRAYAYVDTVHCWGEHLREHFST